MLLRYYYDEEKDIMTIEGVKYSGEFFRAIGEPKEGALYSIRKDGEVRVVTEYTNRNLSELLKFLNIG